MLPDLRAESTALLLVTEISQNIEYTSTQWAGDMKHFVYESHSVIQCGPFSTLFQFKMIYKSLCGQILHAFNVKMLKNNCGVLLYRVKYWQPFFHLVNIVLRVIYGLSGGLSLRTRCSLCVSADVIRKQFMFSVRFYCDAPMTTRWLMVSSAFRTGFISYFSERFIA